MRVFITGGTGLVGSRLVRALRDKGDVPIVLSRRGPSVAARLGAGVEVVAGDPTVEGAWMAAATACDGVVNLAGESIAQRWTPERRAAIRESRVAATTNLARAIAAAPSKPVFVSASAVGYYGPHGDEPLDESSPHGEDTLAQVCRAWEEATSPAEAAGARVVRVRIGVVLAAEGGALAKMLLPFKLFIGGPAGSGRQVVSWIHIDDLIGLILFSLNRDDVRGPLCATAPEPVTMRELCKALGRALGRPSWAPVPRFVLRLALGEGAVIVLTGQRVLPNAAQRLGYAFRYPTVDEALAAELD